MDYDKAASFWEEKDAQSVAMPKALLREKVDGFIEKHNTCALATGSGEFVRCTPIEYCYVDGIFYMFSEGGLKFRALKDNKNICIAIFDAYTGFGQLSGMQVSGSAEVVEPFSDEYIKLLDVKKIPVDVMKKLQTPMNLIKVRPKTIEVLNSDFKKDGYGSRQRLKL